MPIRLRFTQVVEKAEKLSPVGLGNVVAGHVRGKPVTAPPASKVTSADMLVAQPFGAVQGVDDQGPVAVLLVDQSPDCRKYFFPGRGFGKVRRLGRNPGSNR